MTRGSLVLLLLLLLPALPARAASTWYVGKSVAGASDSHRCTNNSTDICLTVARGISRMAGGDTLVVGNPDGVTAEVYDEAIQPGAIPGGSGPDGEPYEAAWPGATVVRAVTPCQGRACKTTLRPSVAANCSMIGATPAVFTPHTDSVASNYIILYGLELDANQVCAVVSHLKLNQAVAGTTWHHVRLQHVWAHDAIGNSSGTGMTVVATDCSQHGPPPCATSPAPHHVEMLDSVFEKFNTQCLSNCRSGPGNHCFYWNGNGTIRRSIISDCSYTGGNGEGIATHNRQGGLVVDFSQNEVTKWGFWGIECSERTSTCNVYDNVIHVGGVVGPQACNAYPCSGITIRSGGAVVVNNTIWNAVTSDSSSCGGICVSGAVSPNGWTIQNNILGGLQAIVGIHGRGTVDHNRCGWAATGCSTTDDPQLTADFHLTGQSPATVVHAGVHQTLFTLDKDGVKWANPPSLGAYEFVGSQSNPPLGHRGGEILR